MHTHTTAGVAVASLQGGLSQSNFYSAQLHDMVAYHPFEGITIHAEEGPRVLASMGNKQAIILRNHGLLSWGQTLEQAFAILWTLQRACEIQLATLSMGAAIPVPETIAAKCTRDARCGPAIGGWAAVAGLATATKNRLPGDRCWRGRQTLAALQRCTACGCSTGPADGCLVLTAACGPGQRCAAGRSGPAGSGHRRRQGAGLADGGAADRPADRARHHRADGHERRAVVVPAGFRRPAGGQPARERWTRAARSGR
jgi:hypothetical protein